MRVPDEDQANPRDRAAAGPDPSIPRGKRCGVSGMCRECRHWHSSPEAVGWGYCRIAATVDGDALVQTTRATAMAGREGEEGDGDAVLLTLSEFGCVQFEPAKGGEA